MLDYYKILGVSDTASAESIKKSFRYLAKRFHPDRNPHRKHWAEKQFRTLVEAYETLMDNGRRFIYDRHFASEQARIQAQKRRPKRNAAEQILYDLLNGNGRQAVDSYEAIIEKRGAFDLLQFFSLKDYLDCKFLLGEEYERQKRYREALEFYEEVFREERQGPRLRFFFEEVRDRIRDIYCRTLARSSPPEKAIEFYRKVLLLGLPRGDQAYVHKKIAERYFDLGDLPAARRELVRAFEMKPNLKGVQKICSKLNWEPGNGNGASESRPSGTSPQPS
ncbi:MAG: DnaJ domain-containing protein [Planctomycetota bacterium]